MIRDAAKQPVINQKVKEVFEQMKQANTETGLDLMEVAKLIGENGLEQITTDDVAKSASQENENSREFKVTE